LRISVETPIVLIEFFRYFFLFLQANAEIMPEIMIRQFPDASIPAHHLPILPFDAVTSELLITP
jgi:hypothetical protein